MVTLKIKVLYDQDADVDLHGFVGRRLLADMFEITSTPGDMVVMHNGLGLVQVISANPGVNDVFLRCSHDWDRIVITNE